MASATVLPNAVTMVLLAHCVLYSSHCSFMFTLVNVYVDLVVFTRIASTS